MRKWAILLLPGFCLSSGCSSIVSGISTTADAATWTGNAFMSVGGVTVSGFTNIKEALTPAKFSPREEEELHAKEFARDILTGSQNTRRLYEGPGGSIITYWLTSQDSESIQFRLEKQETNGKTSYAYMGVVLRNLKKRNWRYENKNSILYTTGNSIIPIRM